jgi:hypothetical protein
MQRQVGIYGRHLYRTRSVEGEIHTSNSAEVRARCVKPSPCCLTSKAPFRGRKGDVHLGGEGISADAKGTSPPSFFPDTQVPALGTVSMQNRTSLT